VNRDRDAPSIGGGRRAGRDWRRSVVASTVALLSGCATVQPKGGFTEVRGLIAERLDQDVQWDQGTPEDARVRETVGKLLQNELAVDAAVQIALLNNPTLQATYEDLGVAQADLVEAGLLKNPVFSGFVRLPHSGPPSQANLEFDVSQEFINILFLPARKRIAATNFEAKKLRVTNAVLELGARVRAAYYGLEAAQNVTEVLSTNAEAAAASAELARRMHEAGNLSDLDLAREIEAGHFRDAGAFLRAAVRHFLITREDLGYTRDQIDAMIAQSVA